MRIYQYGECIIDGLRRKWTCLIGLAGNDEDGDVDELVDNAEGRLDSELD